MPTRTHDPHVGGAVIPKALQREIDRRLRAYAKEHYADSCARLDVRFRGPFCYIDAYRNIDPKATPWSRSTETDEAYRARLRNTPTHLSRLRHFSKNRWSLAFYKYSD